MLYSAAARATRIAQWSQSPSEPAAIDARKEWTSSVASLWALRVSAFQPARLNARPPGSHPPVHPSVSAPSRPHTRPLGPRSSVRQFVSAPSLPHVRHPGPQSFVRPLVHLSPSRLLALMLALQAPAHPSTSPPSRPLVRLHARLSILILDTMKLATSVRKFRKKDMLTD